MIQNCLYTRNPAGSSVSSQSNVPACNGQGLRRSVTKEILSLFVLVCFVATFKHGSISELFSSSKCCAQYKQNPSLRQCFLECKHSETQYIRRQRPCLGLLYMRPLQFWLKDCILQRAWKAGRMCVVVTHACLDALLVWFNRTMYDQEISMGRVVRWKVVTMNVLLNGCRALCEGRPVFGTWTSAQKHWHINCLEMNAVHWALCKISSCS